MTRNHVANPVVALIGGGCLLLSSLLLGLLAIVLPFTWAAADLGGGAAPVDGELHLDFYKMTCPKAEAIIFDVLNSYKEERSTVPGITRLLFHDCFVTGCDASILLDTAPSNQPEIAYVANGVSIRGLDVIADAKSKVEQECPGVVSCADVLAYAARDAVVISGNPNFAVPGGRRDSLTSHIEDAKELPGPDWTMDRIAAAFAKRNVSLEHTVALLGSHSIGVSRCANTIANKARLHAIPGAEEGLDAGYKDSVERQCPSITEGKVALNLADEAGPWGGSYFNDTIHGKAVIPSDLGLMLDPSAKAVAEKYAADPKLWAEKFNEAMLAMGTWNVLTGNLGEVRNRCGYTNDRVFDVGTTMGRRGGNHPPSPDPPSPSPFGD